MRMIVDTSVWIEFFRKNTENEKVQILLESLNTNKPIYITDIILTEIFAVPSQCTYSDGRNIELTLLDYINL